jgi:hypothetical protein
MYIKSIDYINTDDVHELTGKHWSHFEFAQMAENGSYVRLDCSDAGLEDLYESIAWESGKYSITPEELPENPEEEYGDCYLTRLVNQAKLIEILRKQYGLMFEILVWVSW